MERPYGNWFATDCARIVIIPHHDTVNRLRNPFRRDDGAGPALARMLGEAGARADPRVLTPHQLTPELAVEPAAPEVTAVLFMNAAVVSGSGTTFAGDAKPRLLEPSPHDSCLGHYFPPNVLPAYAKLLYGVCPQAWLITIPGYDLGFGEGFSEGTAALFSAARANALELLEALA